MGNIEITLFSTWLLNNQSLKQNRAFCSRFQKNRGSMIGQLFAGGGLGLLVGVLVGLSASPVVSVILGSIAAGLVTLLGFSGNAKDGEPAYGAGTVVRLGSFGVACAFAVVLGIFLRTHNIASPSIAEQVNEVTKAGYSADEARRWVAYRNLGASLEATAGREKAHEGAAAPAASTVLFSGTDRGECKNFDPTQYKNTAEHLYALRQLGGRYAAYADKIASMDSNQQKTTLEGLHLLFCPL